MNVLTPSRLFAALLLLVGPQMAVAAEPLQVEIKKASEKLRDFFAGRRIKELSVGEVACADEKVPASSPPGIRLLLVQELERTELKIKPVAKVTLAVSFRGIKTPLPTDRKVERLVVELRFTASFTADNSQEDILDFLITDEEAVAHIYGVRVYHANKVKGREPETVLAFTKPSTNMDGSVILAGDMAPFGMEILVGGQALQPTDEDGFAHVKLQQDQTYAVRLINRSPIEVAARLSIDGLNFLTFSELRHKEGPYKGCPLYDMVLIPPKSDVIIKGWHKDNATSLAFKITHYADTAAAKMGRTTDIGTITATFCAAWEKTPPEDEPDGSRGPGDAGTGFGESVDAKFIGVRRTIGAVRASVAVRYKVPGPTK
jgi:hypothetical protein